ncbi:MAG: hypothetical protein FE78DRAFT_443205 [Acidomyces sp. 'richmondensis']|nr:MAG: hypothetical protein FE78DRAFT_443205 [Acidomyces sp. 'richmondensis']
MGKGAGGQRGPRAIGHIKAIIVCAPIARSERQRKNRIQPWVQIGRVGLALPEIISSCFFNLNYLSVLLTRLPPDSFNPDAGYAATVPPPQSPIHSTHHTSLIHHAGWSHGCYADHLPPSPLLPLFEEVGIAYGISAGDPQASSAAPNIQSSSRCFHVSYVLPWENSPFLTVSVRRVWGDTERDQNGPNVSPWDWLWMCSMLCRAWFVVRAEGTGWRVRGIHVTSRKGDMREYVFHLPRKGRGEFCMAKMTAFAPLHLQLGIELNQCGICPERLN